MNYKNNYMHADGILTTNATEDYVLCQHSTWLHCPMGKRGCNNNGEQAIKSVNDLVKDIEILKTENSRLLKMLSNPPTDKQGAK